MKRKYEDEDFYKDNYKHNFTDTIQDEIDYLKDNPGFEKLDLSKKDLSGKTLNQFAELIARHPGLKEIDLTDNFNFGPYGAKVLAELILLAGNLSDNPRLTAINLQRNNINWGVEKLAQALTVYPNITKLNLRGNNQGEKANLLAKALANHSKLVELDISANFIGNEFIAILTDIPSLTKLNISQMSSIDDKGFQALARMHNLKELNIGSNRTRVLKRYGGKSEGCQEFVARLAEILAANPQLETLNISSNCINDEEAIAIVKILSVHPGLKNLDISSNRIKELKTIHELANLNLENLDISENKIDEKVVAEAIASAGISAIISNLEALKVSDIFIGNEDTKMIESVILSMDRLTIIKDAPGMNSEVKMNAFISSLEKINLSNESIKDDVTKISSFMSKLSFFAPEKEKEKSQNILFSPRI